MFKSKLIKFGAIWCNPCNQASKYLKQNFDENLFDEVDVTKNEELAQQYGVKNIPTFILFDEQGLEVERFVSFDPARIKSSIQKIS